MGFAGKMAKRCRQYTIRSTYNLFKPSRGRSNYRSTSSKRVGNNSRNKIKGNAGDSSLFDMDIDLGADKRGSHWRGQPCAYTKDGIMQIISNTYSTVTLEDGQTYEMRDVELLEE